MKRYFKFFVALILLSFFVTLTTVFISLYGYREGVIRNIFFEWEIFIYNFLIIFLIMWVLSYILKSLSLSFFITSAVLNLGAFTNFVKIIYREEPFMARDFKIIFEAFTMSKKYDLNFNTINGYAFIGFLIITFFIFIFLRKFEFNYKKRILNVILPTIALSVFMGTIVTNQDIYTRLGTKSGLSPWIEVESYQSKGFVYPFVHSIKSSMPYKYEDFNKKQAKNLYDSYEGQVIQEDKKVNVVVVMLESFKDFYKLQNPKLQFERNPYEYFYKLKEESISGSLLVNSFGGGTFLTETNVISGYKHTPVFNRKTKSYPRYFKEMGYSTLAFHPYIGSFYNRNNVYPNIGFDEFYELNNTFGDIYGASPLDNQLYDFMNEKFNSTKGNKFMFAVTYQNHGPYPIDKLLYEEPYLIWQDEYDIKDYNYFNNYINGIAQSSNSLKILVDNLRQSDEPTIFVAFGDHSPSMGNNKSLCNMLGLSTDISKLSGIYDIYETPYIIWANDKCKDLLGNDFVGEGRDIEPIFLMSDVFNYLGYKGPIYNQYLQDFSQEISIIKENFFKINSEYKDKLSDEEKKKIHEFKNMEYYVSNLKI